MRNPLLAAALVGLLATPLAARAQVPDQDRAQDRDQTQGATIGITGSDSGALADDDPDAISAAQLPAFREYVVREHLPTYTVPDRIKVGVTLPDVGVTYYDVPQTVATTPYRYTVVNGRTVLVEPRSRRIVQVLD